MLMRPFDGTRVNWCAMRARSLADWLSGRPSVHQVAIADQLSGKPQLPAIEKFRSRRTQRGVALIRRFDCCLFTWEITRDLLEDVTALLITHSLRLGEGASQQPGVDVHLEISPLNHTQSIWMEFYMSTLEAWLYYYIIRGYKKRWVLFFWFLQSPFYSSLKLINT